MNYWQWEYLVDLLDESVLDSTDEQALINSASYLAFTIFLESVFGSLSTFTFAICEFYVNSVNNINTVDTVDTLC